MPYFPFLSGFTFNLYFIFILQSAPGQKELLKIVFKLFTFKYLKKKFYSSTIQLIIFMSFPNLYQSLNQPRLFIFNSKLKSQITLIFSNWSYLMFTKRLYQMISVISSTPNSINKKIQYQIKFSFCVDDKKTKLFLKSKQSTTSKILTKNNEKQAQSCVSYERMCQAILSQYSDKIKQSKKIQIMNTIYLKYQQNLQQNKVTETSFKFEYKTIMLSRLLRGFTRIIRRQKIFNRYHLMKIIGKDFDNLKNLSLNKLGIQEISDFIKFFCQIQLKISKFSIISEKKIQIVSIYLQQAYKKLTEKSNQSSLFVLVNPQIQKKRKIYWILAAVRTAQLYKSSLYALFLELTLDQFVKEEVTPHLLGFMTRFLLKPECLITKDIQFKFLRFLTNQVLNTTILKKFSWATMPIFYHNLLLILENHDHLFQLTDVKNVIHKIELHIIDNLEKIKCEDLYLYVKFGQYSPEKILFHQILKSIFKEVDIKGNTSLNPLFFLNVVSRTFRFQKDLTIFDSQWEEKLVNLIRKYLAGDSKKHLQYYQKTLQQIYNFCPSSKIKEALAELILTKNCIIPTHSTLIIDNYLLESQNKTQLYISWLKLKRNRSNSEKVNGLFENVFCTIQSKFKNKQVSSEKNLCESSQIQVLNEFQKNRAGYIKTLGCYCIYFGHQELIEEIAYQQMIHILQNFLKKELFKNYKKIFIQSFDDSITKIDFSQMLNEGAIEKIYSIIQCYLIILIRKYSENMLQTKRNLMRTDCNSLKFIKLLRSNEFLKNLLLKQFIRHQFSYEIKINQNKIVLDCLIDLIKYLTIGFAQSTVQNFKQQTKIQIIERERYNFTFFNILKMYPVQRLIKLFGNQDARNAFKNLFKSTVEMNQNSKLTSAQNKNKFKTQVSFSSKKIQLFQNEHVKDFLFKKYQVCCREAEKAL